VVAGDGHVILRLRGYRTVGLPDPVAADDLAPVRAAMRG
jgi:hypothetical protein